MPDYEPGDPSGIKGVGEIGTVGTAAAIANAVWHATGRRQRTLPIRLDRVVEDQPLALTSAIDRRDITGGTTSGLRT